MISPIVATLSVALALSSVPYSHQTYSIQTSDSLDVGVTIQPQSGWKWNSKYPSKFRIHLGPRAHGWYSFIGNEIRTSLEPTQDPADVVIVANFSICNETTCKIMTNREFRFGDKSSVRKCQTCHGRDLSGKKKNPSIRGLSYSRLYESLATDVPKKMTRVASKLTEEEKQAIARYISGLGESR